MLAVGPDVDGADILNEDGEQCEDCDHVYCCRLDLVPAPPANISIE